MHKLRERNILLFCPSFYQYREIIKNELIKQKANVYDFDERPKNTFIFKVLLRLRLNKLTLPIVDKYYNNIKFKGEDDEVTDVLVINAEAINTHVMMNLRRRFKKAKFTLYMWDSIDNKKNIKEIIELFDKALSFDPQDCRDYSSLDFEPLFYSSEHSRINKSEETPYALSFIGSVHSDRLKIISKTIMQIDNSYVYLFSPSKLLTFVKLLFNIKNITPIHHTKVSLEEVSRVFNQSKAVLDINHPNQTGLTMRTFEVLGAGKKLITTNENIKSYDFFSEESILVINRDNIDKNAISRFVKLNNSKSEEIENHRLDKWIFRVLS